MTVTVDVLTRTDTLLTTFTADEGDGDTRQKATVTEVATVLNKPGSATVHLPLFHPATAYVEMWTTEIRIKRGDTVVFRGPAVQARIQGGVWVVTCVGLAGYLAQSIFGPITTNYLTNPNFETDLSGWTATGTTATHKADVLRFDGPGTVELVETDGGQDSYLEQSFTVDTGEVGLYIEVRAMCWIDPTVDFEPAFEERGLAVGAINSVQTSAWRPINNHTPRGWPQMLVTGINLLPNLTDEQVTVLLYSPKGKIRWGACVATIQESVSTDTEGSDVTETMRRIVAYANTKGDYNLSTSTPASGIGEAVAYQFMDLGNVFDTLGEYPKRGVADFAVDPATRTFTTYSPRKGSDLSGSVTFSVPSEGVISFGHLTDGTETKSGIIAKGPGSGASRALGVATDTSGLDGLLLQGVIDAPPEVTIDALDQYATAQLALRKNVVQIPDFTVAASEIFGTVEVGDTVGISVDLGRVQMTGTVRVTQLVWDPVADTVRVGVS